MICLLNGDVDYTEIEIEEAFTLICETDVKVIYFATCVNSVVKLPKRKVPGTHTISNRSVN